ncbi:MAG: 23S rRNA (pseudouridine(1915)-N(3))-methyltransferase RlmH [Methyloceanibacter sp.]
MRLLIAAVGKLKQGPERELCAHYLARAEAAGRALGIGPLSLIEVPESKGATAASCRKQEATALFAKLPSPHKLVCLDRTGEAMSSEAFAQALAKVRDEGARTLAFLIGGADGLGQEALVRADRRLSLGALTLPHGLARIVLAEQIYRAATILAGHPYHRR